MRIFLTLILGLFFFAAEAQNLDWWDALHDYPNAAGRDRDKYTVLSPGYLGPNALRVPALLNGKIDNVLWLETKAEFHQGLGDRTQNAFLQINVPLAKDKALLYVQSIPVEWWRLSVATRDERRVQEFDGKDRNTGDIAYGIILRVANEDLSKLPNITIRAHAKTTTGSAISNARFTDASMFFFEGTFSKTIVKSEKNSLLLKVMLGFYTWQTDKNYLPNGSRFFQNDAALLGAGVEWKNDRWYMGVDLSGYHGYIGNRDYPLFWRTQLSYKIGPGAIISGFNLGLRHWDWNTITLGYRYFFQIID